MTSAQKRQLRTDIWGWALASPLVLGLLIFTLYPLVTSFVYSFFDVNGVLPIKNFGLQNYIEIFTGDYSKDFFHSLKVTLTFSAIQVPLGLILGYSLALFLNVKCKGSGVFLVLYYLPTLIPAVVAGAIWGDMMNQQYGLFNVIFHDYLGFERIEFQSSENLMASYILMTTFNLGGGSIIWLAGLRGIDQTYYEAAVLDGANAFQKFAKITVPMSTPYIFYNLTMGIIGALQLFNQPYILTGGTGGDGDALKTLNMYIYETAFSGLKMGLASAMAWVLCAIVATLTGLTFTTNKWVYYADED